MRKYIIPALVVTLFSVNSIYAQDATTSLLAKLSAIKTYRADFKQVTRDSKGVIVQRGNGKFYLRRPGMFRWDSMQPTHQIIIARPPALWVYDVDLAQVTRQKLTPENDIAAELLIGNAKAALQKFIVTSSGATYSLKTKPSSNLGVNNVRLTFSGNKLIAMRIQNSYQQISNFTFRNIQYNGKVSIALFSTRWPKDVDVIDGANP